MVDNTKTYHITPACCCGGCFDVGSFSFHARCIGLRLHRGKQNAKCVTTAYIYGSGTSFGRAADFFFFFIIVLSCLTRTCVVIVVVVTGSPRSESVCRISIRERTS